MGLNELKRKLAEKTDEGNIPVSYTHLDVYKRQGDKRAYSCQQKGERQLPCKKKGNRERRQRNDVHGYCQGVPQGHQSQAAGGGT